MFDTVELSERSVEVLLSEQEGHFLDFKSKDISPAKVTKTVSALANAEGGEIFIGIEELKDKGFKHWNGFQNIELANALVQTIEKSLPFGSGAFATFLKARGSYVLKIEARKSPEVVYASDGRAYLRRGAQSIPQDSEEQLERLKFAKGLTSFENKTVQVSLDVVTDSDVVGNFIKSVVPSTTAENWLRKQQLTSSNLPTVAALLLFADEPQASLPKRSGIKLYRYKTSHAEGSRESLAFDPITIEGCLYQQISDAVRQTVEQIESIQILGPGGLEKITYPKEAIHEIITNAIIHRDYSIADDVHVRIFDNRVEVKSPGKLPAHITVQNILEERFARNGAIVRIINKFPNPPNKDIGEGLNTASQAMRRMRLVDPVIEQTSEHVTVTLKHQKLASPEELIMEYLEKNELITNRDARQIAFIGSENRVKRIFQGMIKSELIELVPGRTRYNAAYRKKKR